jgi:hypothetical protein
MAEGAEGASAGGLVHVSGGDARLVERLRKPVAEALDGRRRAYWVRIDCVGRVGEVVVGITGAKGHLPLLFGAEELEPGYVSRVVRETVRRFDL